MNTFKLGKVYLFLGVPLWLRGTLEAETPFHYLVSAADSEYLPDAQTMADYISHSIKGERLGRRVAVPKDGTYVIEVG